MDNLNDINKLPYIYDEFYKNYLIDYYEFNDYKLVKDLSKFNNIKIIILIFEKNNEKFLFGFDDGIIFPYVNFDIFNFNADKYKLKIDNIIKNIVNDIRIYYNGVIKIYNYSYYQYNISYNIFNLLNYKNSSLIDCINILNTDILHGMKYNIKNIINRYIKKKIFSDENILIYFGEISNEIFNGFIQKHFELSERKTKSDRCWEILKEFILNKKAFLVKYKNEYVYFFISKEFSYYGINACSRKSDICTILIYEAFLFLKKYGCNFIYMYHYINDNIDIKLNNISFFKKSMSNKLIDNYYCIFE